MCVFVCECIEEECFCGVNIDIMVVGCKVGLLFVFLFLLFMLIFNVIVVLVIWFGGIEVNNGMV